MMHGAYNVKFCVNLAIFFLFSNYFTNCFVFLDNYYVIFRLGNGNLNYTGSVKAKDRLLIPWSITANQLLSDQDR